MTYEILKITDNEGILTVTITREKALNALNRQTFNELEHFFNNALTDYPRMTGIILTGAGPKSFAAGADISEFLTLGKEGAAKMSRRGQVIFDKIEYFPKPVIAAVNGFALGGGCELAMACHMRIASENARFGQPEVNLGILPGYGGTQRLVQLIGKGKAMELLLTADMVKAPEALALGLVNHVVPAEELLAKATEILKKTATKGPLAIARCIRCVNANFDETVNGYDEEVKAFGEISNTEDFVEGATAFLEKRAPKFTGK